MESSNSPNLIGEVRDDYLIGGSGVGLGVGVGGQSNNNQMDFLDHQTTLQSHSTSNEPNSHLSTRDSRPSFSHLMNSPQLLANQLPDLYSTTNSSNHIYPGTLTDSPPTSTIPLPLPLLSHPSYSSTTSSRPSPPALAPLNIPPGTGSSNSNSLLGLNTGPSLNLILPTPSTARPGRREKGQATLDFENILGSLVDQEQYNSVSIVVSSFFTFKLNYIPSLGKFVVFFFNYFFDDDFVVIFFLKSGESEIVTNILILRFTGQ